MYITKKYKAAQDAYDRDYKVATATHKIKKPYSKYHIGNENKSSTSRSRKENDNTTRGNYPKATKYKTTRDNLT